MLRAFLAVAWLACVALPLQAEQPDPGPVVAKLVTARFPVGWTVTQRDGEIEAHPGSSESEGIQVAECSASSRDCLSECNVAAARNYLYFLENNDPPASRATVARSDHVFEYRADGKFSDSTLWVAASVLCGNSGLVVVLAQSESPSLAVSYVDAVVRSVAWQKQ